MIRKIIPSLIMALCAINGIYAQDTIVKRNNEVVIANIIEVASSTVKYKRFDLPEGPVFTNYKSDIIKIKYRNGLVDIFNPEPVVQPKKGVVSEVTKPQYTLSMIDGTRLKGEIVSQNDQEVVFKDNTIGEKTISRSKIKDLSSEFGNAVKVLTLTDGSIITGKIINKTQNNIVIETKELGVLTIPQSKVIQERDFEDATITDKGSIWYQNPNCTRYLFAPSAFSLKKGEGYYQNIYGAGNSFNLGLNDHVTIGGGLVGPVGAFVNVKVGVKLTSYITIAAGAIVGNSFFPIGGNNFGAGLGFAVVTFGNLDHNITVGTGYGFMDSKGSARWQDKPLYVANGMLRVAKKFALVSENWIANVPVGWLEGHSTGQKHYDAFFSYAFRYMGQRNTLDAGFLNTPELINSGWYIGIPYIGFVIRFGKYKEE